MKHINILKKKFTILKLGFGTCQIGGPTKFGKKQIGMGAQKRKDSIEAIKIAIAKGINFFDTADIYGHGKSEKLLGECIKNRNDIFICTKFGNRIIKGKYHFDSSPDYLIRSVKKSLLRLNQEYLDIILLHSPPSNIKLSKKFKETVLKFKNDNKINYFGISFSTINDAINFIKKDNTLDFIEIIYNLVDRRAEKLFKLCKKNNIKIIARMPLASGFLSKSSFNKSFKPNDFRSNTDDQFLKWIKSIEKKIEDEFNSVDIRELSLRYVLSMDDIFVVIPGMRNKYQVINNFESFNKGSLSKVDIKKIEKLPICYDGWK